MSKGFRFGLTLEEFNNQQIREHSMDFRANARFAAHSLARLVLREAKFDRSIAADIIMDSRTHELWFVPMLVSKFNVSKSLIPYATKVALERLFV